MPAMRPYWRSRGGEHDYALGAAVRKPGRDQDDGKSTPAAPPIIRVNRPRGRADDSPTPLFEAVPLPSTGGRVQVRALEFAPPMTQRQ
jgi:hypothetical protein